MDILIIIIFIIGSMFFVASHIPAWFLSGKKPTHKNWKLYGFIAFAFWLLVLVLANVFL